MDKAGVAHIPPGWNGFAYVVEGEVQIGNTRVEAGYAAFPGDGDFKIESESDARLMLIAGQPHESLWKPVLLPPMRLHHRLLLVSASSASPLEHAVSTK